jgi:hypothetical protein
MNGAKEQLRLNYQLETGIWCRAPARLIILAVLFVLSVAFCSCEKKHVPPVGPDSVIEISLLGGGIYGGINPTTENRITIQSDGQVTELNRSLYGGTNEIKTSVPRAEVLDLAREIAALGFFSMDELYDCATGDKKCESRKTSYPPAVPMVVEVRIDSEHRIVKVTVFENGAVLYPEELDQIVPKIRELVRRHKTK